MRVLVALLSLAPILTWFFWNKKKKDLLSPISILTILYAVRVSFPILALSNMETVDSYTNEMIYNSVSSTENYTIFVIISIIAYYLTIVGIHFRVKNNNNESFTEKDGTTPQVDKVVYKRMGIVLWIIGMIATLITVYKIGGVDFLIHNQYARTTVLRDLDFLSWVRPFLSYGLLLIMYSRGKKSISIKFFIFIIVTGLMQGLGARRAMIMLVIEFLFIYHYTINKISIKDYLKLKYILFGFVIYVIFSFLLFLRGPSAINNTEQGVNSFIQTGNLNLAKTLVDESYVGHHILTVSYFKDHEYWYGRSFFGLITSVIPSSLYEQKPPVDDGTYLYSISRGRTDISPPMSFKDLDVSSMPLETFSSMYANFGVIGVLIGSVIKGMVIGYAYRKMRQKSFSLLSIYAYVIILFSFELATLNIFQTVQSIAMMFFIIKITNMISSRNTLSKMEKTSV